MAAEKEKSKSKVVVVGSSSQSVEDVMATINSRFGAGSLILGNNPVIGNFDVISTGSLALDMALGIGGLPRGRIVEIYGPESAGKTTTALCVIAQAVKNGGNAAFIDVEHALSTEWAAKLGVKIDKLAVSQPDFGEQALEIAEVLIKSKAFDVVVIDSVAALTPKEELDGELSDQQMAPLARLMSKAMRRLSVAVSESNTLVIFLNQLREKVGVSFGNPEVQPGGRALKFYASVRIEVKAGGKIRDDGTVLEMAKATDRLVGRVMKVKVVKNKCAPPFKAAEVHLMFDDGKYGFDPYSEVLDVAKAAGVIEVRGSSYTYGELKMGQGKVKAEEFLRNDKTIYDEIVKKLSNSKQTIFVDDDEVKTSVETQLD